MLAEILTQVGKQSGRYPGIFFRLSHCNIEEMREDLQEVCTRISEKLDSADDQQKKLILDALQVEVTVTGQKVNLGLELGVAPEVSRLTTTGRTSGCFSAGAYNYRAIYVMNPVAVKMLVA